MSGAANKAIVRRVIDEAWNKGNLSILDEVMVVDHVDHDDLAPAIGEGGGREHAKQTIAEYRAAFPDLLFTAEDMIAEGDRVVTRWRARGTQTGPLVGIPPTGKLATVTGIFIDRLAQGQIVETWGNWDALGLMQQLGVAPVPGLG
jgi:steroid delta-isomerase-like uncharacterized protein